VSDQGTEEIRRRFVKCLAAPDRTITGGIPPDVTIRQEELKYLLSRIDVLEARVKELEYCDCGRPLSKGQCGICDNDD